jgi:hypothetical protein
LGGLLVVILFITFDFFGLGFRGGGSCFVFSSIGAADGGGFKDGSFSSVMGCSSILRCQKLLSLLLFDGVVVLIVVAVVNFVVGVWWCQQKANVCCDIIGGQLIGQLVDRLVDCAEEVEVRL